MTSLRHPTHRRPRYHLSHTYHLLRTELHCILRRPRCSCRRVDVARAIAFPVAQAEVVEAALAGGMRTYEETLQVLLTQADALRRAAAAQRGDMSKMGALRTVFQKATSTVAELFPKHGALASCVCRVGWWLSVTRTCRL